MIALQMKRYDILVSQTINLKFTFYKPNQLVQDSIKRWAYVNMVMNLQVPQKMGISFSAKKLSTFQRQPCIIQLPI